MRFVLVLEPSTGDPGRAVGGLPVALRLALDAQRAGFEAVVRGPVATRVLSDPRLRIPVLDRAPEDARAVSVPATVVVHRDAFRAVAGGDTSFAALAAASERADYGFAPVVVTDARSARAAERALFRSLRKVQDGWTARALNRPISLALSRWLVRTPLHPNHVSVCILFVGLAGAFLAARGGYASMLAGAALFQAQSVLDGCDGEMSRVTYRGSLLGEWLDTIGDDLTNYGFFAGAAIGLHHDTGNPIYAAAGVMTVLCGATASLIEYRYLLKIGSGDLLKYPLSQAASSGGRFSALAPLFKRDTFVFLTLLSAAAGALGPMLVVFALAAAGILVSVILAEIRMARERRSAAAERPG